MLPTRGSVDIKGAADDQRSPVFKLPSIDYYTFLTKDLKRFEFFGAICHGTDKQLLVPTREVLGGLKSS